MTSDEIRDWALRSGFTEAGETTLKAPFHGGQVAIEFLRTQIRVQVEKEIGGETKSFRLGTFHPKMVTLDEDGMLNGMGLGVSFLLGIASRCDERPAWVPTAVWEKVAEAQSQPPLP